MSASAGLRRLRRSNVDATSRFVEEASTALAVQTSNRKKQRKSLVVLTPDERTSGNLEGPHRAAFCPPEILSSIIAFLILAGSEHDCLSTLRVNKAWFHATVRLLWRRPPIRPATWDQFLHALRRGGTTSPNPSLPRRRVLRSVPCPIIYGELVRELLLSDIQENITDRALLSIAEFCPNLRIINIERCQRATSVGVGKLVTLCEKLEQMDLTGIKAVNDDGLRRMFPTMRSSIKNLSLTLSGQVTSVGLLDTLAMLPKLERIWIQHCEMLTDESAAGMFTTCPELNDISLLDCRMCTSATVDLLASQIGSRLTQLTLGVSEHIRDPAVHTLVTNCPNLHGLTLALLRHITDATLFSIAAHLPKLHELGIFSSPHITNTGVHRLSLGCKRLERLCLYDCQALTAEAFVSVDTYLVRLDYLNIEHCRVIEATPEIRNLWKRCKDFYASRELLNALHIADLMYYSESLFGLSNPMQMSIETV
ncbi:hypothetical protein DFJ77DRAFT_507948 [Powellomyces hirtus]|nr:hypothetical protein DFJ77DRAFT_507948 [Powellomyces hirtus]